MVTAIHIQWNAAHLVDPKCVPVFVCGFVCGKH